MKKITRIRYEEVDGVLTSQVMMTRTHEIVAVINLIDKAWYIDEVDGSMLTPRTGFNTKQQALKEVKAKLKELGVQFYDEVRVNKKKSVTAIEKKNKEQDLVDLEMRETEEWLLEPDEVLSFGKGNKQ